MRGTVAKRLRREAGRLARETQEPGLLRSIIRKVRTAKDEKTGDNIEIYGATAFYTGYRRYYQNLKRFYKRGSTDLAEIGPLATSAKSPPLDEPLIQAGVFVSSLMKKVKGQQLVELSKGLIPKRQKKTGWRQTAGQLFTRGCQRLASLASSLGVRRITRAAE
jgi:hypothetical protein